MTKQQYTPTPWYVREDVQGRAPAISSDAPGNPYRISSEIISSVHRDEDAAFIVRAVNAHEELVDELKSWHLECLVCKGGINSGSCQTAKAIAKAEGTK